jgi:hypothetical protein
MKTRTLFVAAILASSASGRSGVGRLEAVQKGDRLAYFSELQEVRIIRAGTVHRTETGMTLEAGDRIETGKEVSALLRFDGGYEVLLDSSTEMQVLSPSLFLRAGRVLVRAVERARTALKLKTEFVTAGVEGTLFRVTVRRQEVTVDVVESRVRIESVTDAWAPRIYRAQESARIVGAASPQPTVRVEADELGAIRGRFKQLDRLVEPPTPEPVTPDLGERGERWPSALPTRRPGRGLLDLLGKAEDVVRVNIDGDSRDELMLLRPGLAKPAWMLIDYDESTESYWVTEWAAGEISSSADRAIALNLDLDEQDEVLLYESGHPMSPWTILDYDQVTRSFSSMPPRIALGARSTPSWLEHPSGSTDRILALNVDGDLQDELLLYWPGPRTGVWMLVDYKPDTRTFSAIVDRPYKVPDSKDIDPFGLQHSQDQVVVVNVDADRQEELLLYRPARGLGVWELVEYDPVAKMFVALTGRSGGESKPYLRAGGLSGRGRPEDRIVAANLDLDPQDELLLYRLGGPKTEWVLLDYDPVKRDYFPIVTADSHRAIDPFGLSSREDRITGVNVDRDLQGELLIHRKLRPDAWMLVDYDPGKRTFSRLAGP